MAFDLYNVLGIAPQASSDDVRRAYYRLVRQHPPEKDPEGFKAIRSAFETLSDSRARRNYDAFEQHGDELNRLFDEAHEHIGKGEWKEAARRFKRVVVLAPEADFGWNELGNCYLGAQDWVQARKVLSSLVAKTPDVALYWSNLGFASLLEAENLDGQAADRKTLLCKEARKHFEHATRLEPDSSQYLLAVARTFNQEGRYAEAIDWTERAITASQKGGGVPDFEALFFLCTIHLWSGSLQDIPNVASRIISLLPADEDVRKYAAWRFIEFAVDLGKVHNFKAAGAFIKAALQFDPSNEDLKKYRSWSDAAALAGEEWEAIQKDNKIIGIITCMVQLYLCDAYELEMEGGRAAAVAKIDEGLPTWPAADVLASLAHLKSRYPGCYGLNREGFDSLETAARKVTASASDCFIVTATFGTPYAQEVRRYREFRDEHLARTRLGRLIIKAYYRVGPFLAKGVVAAPFVKRPLACLLRVVSLLFPTPKLKTTQANAIRGRTAETDSGVRANDV